MKLILIIALALLCLWLLLLLRLLRKEGWEYGTCWIDGGEPRVARRNRWTGEVQFVMWKAGESQAGYIHKKDFWVNYHSYWWPNFHGINAETRRR
jgi:hypothetical protein